jgi:hypothetical protein
LSLRFLLRCVVAILLAFGVAPAAAQAEAQSSPAPAALPFGPGEQALFQVRLGGVSVGRGSMQVLGVEKVDGFDTFHTRMVIAGGIPLARVDDRFDSWIDVAGLFSRRFDQDQKEIRFRRKRRYDFFPERRVFVRENGETGTLPTSEPLDDVSFLYFTRTLPLRVGESYTLNRYFKEEGNPVVIQVLRRERITVPAGTFNTIVVRPIIRTRGLFGEGGQAEVFFSDDERRIPVQIRSRVPVVGSLSLHLQEYRPGTTVRGAARP